MHHKQRSDGEVIRKGLLSVRTIKDADRYVVAPAGDLDRTTAEFLDEQLAKAEASAARQVILDLSELTFMDSTGLRLILAADARSRADSNRLRLVRGPRQVQRVFELTGMTDLPFIDPHAKLAANTLDGCGRTAGCPSPFWS